MAPRTQGRVKRVLAVRGTNDMHWVGNGFPVRTLFSYNDSPQDFSPFLLLDYAAPRTFPPTSKRLGVGEHPHRGFETVTIVFAGEVEHRDSSGGGGKIGPGDVQWMTAGGGLVHEEFHGRDFADQGGAFEMVQLWVNLPKKDKLTPPRYQGLLDAQIPKVTLGSAGSTARIIAGELDGKQGPAQTFTPMNVWDLHIAGPTQLEVTEGFTTLLVVRNGHLRVNGTDVDSPATLVQLEREGTTLELDSPEGASVLLLSGQRIDEPVVGYGPFVMNTAQEIRQAIDDFQSGKMGQLA